MKVQGISASNSIFFGAGIIDSHAHRGVEGCRWNSLPFCTEKMDEFIKQPLKININGDIQTDNVARVLVSSIEGLTWSAKQQSELEKSGGSKFSLKPEELIFEKDEIAANLDMINHHKKDPVYEVMAVCQPSKTNGSANNIRKLINENEDVIVGLKFHPQGLMLNADSELYDDYLKLASEKKLPALFHSQVSIDYDIGKPRDVLNWSDPEYIYALARRHPDVPVILGHTGAGGSIAHQKAIDVIVKSIENNDAKLYAEISWMDFVNGQESKTPQSIIDLIQKMKQHDCLDRILFGTDAPLGCYGEKLVQNESGETISAKQSYETTIGRIKTVIKNNFGEESDGIINKIFYENADELFFQKNWAKPIKETVSDIAEDIKEVKPVEIVEQSVKRLSKTKLACYIIAGLAVVSSVVYACTNKSLRGKLKGAASK